MSRALPLCCVLLLLSPSAAAAEWHLTPMVGLTMLGSTTIADPELATDKHHWNLGGAVSLVGGGVVGVEAITNWTPGFFEQGDSETVRNSRVFTLMGNVVLTAPQRWTEYSLRPFVSGGLGLMQIVMNDRGLFPVDLNVAAYNVGGGAIGFLSQRTGLRFDFRYYSVLDPSDHGPISIGDANLRYVTLTVGIVFRR